MKKNVVRLLTFVLLILMVSGMFAGCAEKEPEPLHICVDIGYVNPIRFHSSYEERFEAETLITNMLQAGKQKGIEVPRDFEIEFLPKEGVERETALDRIRTEVMSGGGPDLFIVACNEKDPVFSVHLYAIL